jgi:hypothetical protein
MLIVASLTQSKFMQVLRQGFVLFMQELYLHLKFVLTGMESILLLLMEAPSSHTRLIASLSILLSVMMQ